MSLVSIAHVWAEDTLEKDVNINKNSSCTAKYIVTVSTTEDTEKEVLTYARNNVPTAYNGMPIKTVGIEERLNEKIWKVAVKYAYDETNSSNANEDEKAVGDDSTYSFEISTETRKMVYSFGLKNRFPSTAPTPQAGIRDGEGIDTIMPVAHFSETHRFTECPVSYRKRVASLVGKINSATFKGYGRGEVLFMGASGSKNGDDTWSITFKFATAEDQSGLTIGSITGVSKDAWDCIWVKSRDVNIPNVGLIRQAQFVYTEQVYEFDDFGKLGI